MHVAIYFQGVGPFIWRMIKIEKIANPSHTILSKMFEQENNTALFVQVFCMILDPVGITLYWNVLTMNTKKYKKAWIIISWYHCFCFILVRYSLGKDTIFMWSIFAVGVVVYALKVSHWKCY